MMDNLQTYEEHSVPVWALCYLFYGESEGLSDAEKAMIDNWHGVALDSGHVAGLMSIDEAEGEYFSNNPVFGLPCTCVTLDLSYEVNHE